MTPRIRKTDGIRRHLKEYWCDVCKRRYLVQHWAFWVCPRCGWRRMCRVVRINEMNTRDYPS